MVKRKNYDWDKIRKEFQESDLCFNAFSKQKDIPISTAHAHLKDLIAPKDANDTSDDYNSNEEGNDPFEFVPIEVMEAEAIASTPDVTFIRTTAEDNVPQTEASSSPIEIKIKEWIITLNDGFNKATLKDALEVLTSLC